jgi:hypothetical protein
MDADNRSVDRLGELRTSARGWHGVQLAVLGFIGLCGALQRDGGSSIPGWLQTTAAVLVLAAFALACVATVLVALAAWPIYGSGSGDASTAAQIGRTSLQLRVGITLTFLAVAVLALATSSAWWPDRAAATTDSTAVEVATQTDVICGALGEPPGDGLLTVSVGGRLVALSLAEVISVRPVEKCA